MRLVELRSFWIGAWAVTNAQFASFVRASGYVTEAERLGWSFVFAASAPAGTNTLGHAAQAPWWVGVEGACWRHPEGPGSSTDSRQNHPVVHMSWHDADAYCRWQGVRLPTEAEWECAARGRLVQKRYPWGDELMPGGRHRCNIWQGDFPNNNLGEDGFVGTAPVDAYLPNGFGLYNTSGNVWEWCSDWWSSTWHRDDRLATRIQPQGPASGAERVVRGGSHLCHASYCNRYRVAARTRNTPDSTSGHTGFRCAADA